jgi:hypothetical protein
MITGRRAFAHATHAGLIAAIMTADPDFAAVGNSQLERVLRPCLEKDPTRRWQNALDLKQLLEWPPFPAIGQVAATVRPRIWPWAGVAVLLTGAALLGGYALRRPQPAAEVRFSTVLHGLDGWVMGSGPRMSPDGSRIAYIARNASGKTELWIHDLRSDKSAALAGTEGADVPFCRAKSRTAFVVKKGGQRAGLSGVVILKFHVCHFFSEF